MRSGDAAFGDEQATPWLVGADVGGGEARPDQPSPRMMSLLPSEVQRNAAR